MKKEFKNLDKIQKTTERMIQNTKLQEEESLGKKVFNLSIIYDQNYIS